MRNRKVGRAEPPTRTNGVIPFVGIVCLSAGWVAISSLNGEPNMSDAVLLLVGWRRRRTASKSNSTLRRSKRSSTNHVLKNDYYTMPHVVGQEELLSLCLGALAASHFPVGLTCTTTAAAQQSFVERRKVHYLEH